MAKKGKKYIESKKSFDTQKEYELSEALDIVEKTAKANFDETVELHVRLGVDSRHADQQVRGTVVLPHGTGRDVKVLAIVKDDKVEEALSAGADYAGSEEYTDKIQKENWLDFDVIVTSPDMMGQVGRLGRVLGPQGLKLLSCLKIFLYQMKLFQLARELDCFYLFCILLYLLLLL